MIQACLCCYNKQHSTARGSLFYSIVHKLRSISASISPRKQASIHTLIHPPLHSLLHSFNHSLTLTHSLTHSLITHSSLTHSADHLSPQPGEFLGVNVHEPIEALGKVQGVLSIHFGRFLHRDLHGVSHDACFWLIMAYLTNSPA
jgi:hypothetical protein